MTIDVTRDDVFPVQDLAEKLLPRPVSGTTLWRWYTHGYRGVRLETAPVGRYRYSTEAAFREFLERMREATAADAANARAGSAGPAANPDAERRARTDAKLAEAGML